MLKEFFIFFFILLTLGFSFPRHASAVGAFTVSNYTTTTLRFSNFNPDPQITGDGCDANQSGVYRPFTDTFTPFGSSKCGTIAGFLSSPLASGTYYVKWVGDVTDTEWHSQTFNIGAGDPTPTSVPSTPTPTNAPPQMYQNTDVVLNQGDTYSWIGKMLDPDSTSWTGTVNYGDGGVETLMITYPFYNLTHTYNTAGTFLNTVNVTDDQGATGVDTSTIIVRSPPFPTPGGTLTVSNYDTTIIAFHNIVPDPQLVGDGCDGRASGIYRPFTKTFIPFGRSQCGTLFGFLTSPLPEGTYYIKWVGDVANILRVSQTFTIGAGDPTPTPVNTAPVVNELENMIIEEGDIYTATGSFTDSDSSSWTATVDYGEGAGAQALSLNPDKTFMLNNLYEDNGTYTVIVTITDDNGAVDTETVVVTVNNATPQVGTITASVNPVQVFSATSTTATFTDEGVFDTHTAVWDWGDGLTSLGDIVESNGSGTVTGDHVYLAAGVYEVTLTVTDNNNASDVEVYQYLSVYNPTPQGLFNGVRKFTTPAGSYTANPSLSGQVMFGVSAKYQGIDPVGDMSMNFQQANFEFESTSIMVLVTANGEAMLRGTGIVNGQSGYTFLVTGLDGGPGGDDFVRFQIKDAANNVIFDSQPGAVDTADPTALITAGNIVIH